MVHSFSPVLAGKAPIAWKSGDELPQGTVHPFSYTVLSRGVRDAGLILNAFCLEVGWELCRGIFSPVIVSKDDNLVAGLSFHVCYPSPHIVCRLTLPFERECSGHARVVVDHREHALDALKATSLNHSDVGMNEVETTRVEGGRNWAWRTNEPGVDACLTGRSFGPFIQMLRVCRRV